MKRERKRINSEQENPVRVVHKTLPATRKILQILPEADIQLTLDVFHELRTLKRLSEIQPYPKAELRTIKKALKRIQLSGWMDKTKSENIYFNIICQIDGCKGCVSLNNDRIKTTIKRGKRGADKNFALDALSFALVYMLRKKTKKPHYELVSNFLAEHGIYESTEYIRKERSKQDIFSVMQILRHLGSFHDDEERIATKEEQKKGIVVSIYNDSGKFDRLVKCLEKYKGKEITPIELKSRTDEKKRYKNFMSVQAKLPKITIKNYNPGKGIEFIKIK